MKKKFVNRGIFLLTCVRTLRTMAFMFGTQAMLARRARLSPQMLVDLLKGRRNASAPIADRLAVLTGTDIRVWLMGGDPDARRDALKAWAARRELEKEVKP